MSGASEQRHLSGWSEFVRSAKRARFEVALRRWLRQGKSRDGDELISQHDLWLDPRWLVRELVPLPKERRSNGAIAPLDPGGGSRGGGRSA